MYINFQLTFIVFQTNVIYLAIYATVLLLDGYSIIVYFTNSVNKILYFLIYFGFPFLFYYPFKVFSQHNYSNLQKNLSFEIYEKFEFDESNQTPTHEHQLLLKDTRKVAYFSSLGIDKSSTQAIKYLAVGIAEQCDLFLDMSLIKFVSDHYHTSICFCLITQLLSYFPHESRLLNYFFLQDLTFSNLSIHQRFLLFQVYQVKNLRESSSSSELALKLGEIKNL
jgi:hypothetical protein